MRWLVALMMLMTAVFHTLGHGVALADDSPGIVAAGSLASDGVADIAGCHMCTCVHVMGPSLPTSVPEQIVWRRQVFAVAHDTLPAGLSRLPPPHPPRA